jgi:hypothetical protein
MPAPQTINIVLYYHVELKELQAQGKAYRWERPSHCPGCNGVRLWGHGYVLRYFQGFLAGLWLKRWRCCDCTQVHTLRPFGWQSRLLHPLALMREAMLHKIRHGRFSHSLASRQVQQYWWQNLKRWAYSQSLSLSMHMLEDHVARDFPLGVGKIFTSRLLPFRAGSRPYLPFALNTSVPFI